MIRGIHFLILTISGTHAKKPSVDAPKKAWNNRQIHKWFTIAIIACQPYLGYWTNGRDLR